jgi:hypothetical protein
MPERHVLLSDLGDAEATAKKLSVPVKTTREIGRALSEIRKQEDTRAVYGGLEAEFHVEPGSVDGKMAVRQNVPNGDAVPSGGGLHDEEAGHSQKDVSSERLETALDSDGGNAIDVAGADLDTAASEHESPSEEPKPAREAETAQAEVSPTDVPGPEDSRLDPDSAARPSNDETKTLPTPNFHKPDEAPSAPTEVVTGAAPVTDRSVAEEERAKAPVPEEGSSDEEVVVFKPRPNRNSYSARATAEASRSQPGTAGKDVQGATQAAQGLKPAKVQSTLKPQSPVFTPRSLVPPAQLSEPAITEMHNTPETIVDQPPVPAVTKPQGRRSPPRQPRGSQYNRNLSQDILRHNRDRDILQRQREVIQRQAQNAAKSKPPPREVQMEPTDNPTIIDPDAFDRSYVVKPPSASTPAVPNAGAHHYRQGGRPRPNPQVSPAPQTAAEDVEFVLKSGTPRGSTRGRGKLWVPS